MTQRDVVVRKTELVTTPWCGHFVQGNMSVDEEGYLCGIEFTFLMK